MTSFTGTEFTGSGSDFFIAYARVLSDVDGDGRVDIVDAAHCKLVRHQTMRPIVEPVR